MSKALKAAIEANDPAAAKAALKTVKNLSRKLPKADPPLAYACKRGADAVVDVLFQAGAPLPGPDEFEGDHPFALAAESGHPQVIARLAARDVPHNVVEHTLFRSVLDGREEVVRAILENCKPAIPQRTLEISTSWKDGRIFKLLLEHGANVNMTHSGEKDWLERGRTPLHDAAGSGQPGALQLLLDHGAQVDAEDALGRTPLMRLAAQMPWLDRQQRAQANLERAPAVLRQLRQARAKAQAGRQTADGIAAARLLLGRGDHASRTDRFGNDALMYYEWERRCEREEPNGQFIALLQQAGARGGGPSAELFWAIWTDDITAARSAITAGADLNHQAPPPSGTTPLIMARSAAMIQLLLEAGADANKPSLGDTPLISAARSGELEIVKLLVKAGADIHALQPCPPGSEYVANAYSAAALNRKPDVAEYLKSLGAGKPVLRDWKPLQPGVGIWENFSEVIVRGDVRAVANALAQLIGGTVRENVYGQDLQPGKRTYVVLRPKGMAWCNLLQVTPPQGFFDADRSFLQRLARAARSPVILAEYSDAAAAAQLERFEPEGTSRKDDGWDRETLEEVVGELGKKAPAAMKKRLADMEKSPEVPGSMQRLEQSALAEKFAIAWGGLQAEPGHKVDVSFTNLPAEAFDGVAWVSN